MQSDRRMSRNHRLLSILLALAVPLCFEPHLALTTPTSKVLTLTLHPATTFAPSYFDHEGRRIRLSETDPGAWWALSWGLGVSYGFTDQVGATLEWFPGFTVPSGYLGDDDRYRDGASNLRAEVPVVLLRPPGEAEPGALGNGPFTLTAAPVAVVKIAGFDMAAQYDRRRAGEAYVAEHADPKAHAAGLATSQSLKIVPRFSVRARQELLWYFPADYAEQSLAAYEQNVVRADLSNVDTYEKIRYRYRVGGSLEGKYELESETTGRWTPGLSVGGWFCPAPIVDDVIVEDTQSFLLSARPSVEWAPAAWDGQTTFALGFSIPLWGRNTDATHEVALETTFRLLGPYSAAEGE